LRQGIADLSRRFSRVTKNGLRKSDYENRDLKNKMLN